MRKQKADFVADLTTLVRQVKAQPETTKRPNKWRGMWIKDVGSLLTRLNTTARKLAKAESKIKSLTE